MPLASTNLHLSQAAGAVRPALTGEDKQAAEPALTVRGLNFSHANIPVLENINLTVPQGELLAIIGPNGGGKTTLLKLILGLLTPQNGSIAVFGAPPAAAGGQSGYVPQYSGMELDFPSSVLEMVLMGAAKRSFWGGGWSRSKAAKETALAHLHALGLADEAYRPVEALSGGQRRRALVARALMGKPDDGSPFLLLQDEPTAGIDPEGAFCFYEFLGKLRGQVTIIVVSHDLSAVSSFFSRVVFLNRNLSTLPENGKLSPENLITLFGQHAHTCPWGDLQHVSGLRRDTDRAHACAHACGEKPQE